MWKGHAQLLRDCFRSGVARDRAEELGRCIEPMGIEKGVVGFGEHHVFAEQIRKRCGLRFKARNFSLAFLSRFFRACAIPLHQGHEIVRFQLRELKIAAEPARLIKGEVLWAMEHLADHACENVQMLGDFAVLPVPPLGRRS